MHSHVLLKFVRRLSRSLDHMSTPCGTTLPSGDFMYSDRVLKAFPIIVDDRELFANFIVLDMDEYEIIQNL